MSTKLMTVADLAAYLRTIPNQNMPVRIEATGYFWHDFDQTQLIDLCGAIDSVDYDKVCRIHIHSDNVQVLEPDDEPDDEYADEEMLDDDFDGNFVDEPDLVARSKQMADFYGVRG